MGASPLPLLQATTSAPVPAPLSKARRPRPYDAYLIPDTFPVPDYVRDKPEHLLTSWEKYIIGAEDWYRRCRASNVKFRADATKDIVRHNGHGDWRSIPALIDTDLIYSEFVWEHEHPKFGKVILSRWVLFGEGEREVEQCRKEGGRTAKGIGTAAEMSLMRRRVQRRKEIDALSEARRAGRRREGRGSHSGRARGGKDEETEPERRMTLAGSRIPMCLDGLAPSTLVSLLQSPGQLGAEGSLMRFAV